MAQWLVTYHADPPQYEATRNDGASVRVPLTRDDVSSYRAAALMLRARVIGRWEDTQPVFAARADNIESVRFAEMLNA